MVRFDRPERAGRQLRPARPSARSAAGSRTAGARESYARSEPPAAPTAGRRRTRTDAAVDAAGRPGGGPGDQCRPGGVRAVDRAVDDLLVRVEARARPDTPSGSANTVTAPVAPGMVTETMIALGRRRREVPLDLGEHGARPAARSWSPARRRSRVCRPRR